MMPLDVGDRLIDRSKSSFMLHYLAKASYREKKRELKKQRLEVGLHRLRQLNTDELKKHVGHLEKGVSEVEQRTKLIEQGQLCEEKTHEHIENRLERIHKHLEQYRNRQEKVSGKIGCLEDEYKEKFASKKERLAGLNAGLKNLVKAYDKAKASKKYSKKQLLDIAKRIAKLKAAVEKIE